MSIEAVAPRRLAVAIIRARYNPYGGAERFVQRALGALSNEAVSLTIIARDWQGTPAGEAMANVRLHKVDPFYLGNVWRDASFGQAVLSYLRHGEFDLVQSHERIPGVQIYRAGDGVHAEYLAQRMSRANGSWQRLTLRCNPYHWHACRVERQMFRHPALEAVICNSTMVRNEIVAHFGVDPRKLRLIRNGVDLERFAPPSAAERAQARTSLALPAEAPVFAFVGSGFERKGVADAIRTLASESAPAQARLVIAGGDRRARRYRQLADQLGVGERVLFAGSLVDVRPVLHAADAFLLPTLYDPFPNAVLEALACGLPVVTSPKCGAAELIEAGVNGFVCKPDDHRAMAIELSEILRRPGMRAEARSSAMPYSLKNLAAELVELYRELMR